MWSGEFLAKYGKLGYNIILRGTVKTTADNAEETTKEDTILNQLNNNAQNDLILAQYGTVCLHIIE